MVAFMFHFKERIFRKAGHGTGSQGWDLDPQGITYPSGNVESMDM